MLSVLVIEDDKTINSLLCSIITKSGYLVDSAENGLDGLDKALSGDYNMILMDLMLPLKTGEEVLKELRSVKSTPVIIISAKLEVYNRIELFKIGADDYITKPFDIDEVMLRIQAVLRRTEAQTAVLLTFRDIELDTDSKRVYVKGNEITCTAAEYAILELILANFPNFEAKSITPHFEDSGGPVYAHADRKMLTRVIQNLISNGVKYGNDRLDFTLTADEAVQISVSNPISDNEIDTEKMFDKFYRASGSRTAGGAGIGLYICKQFVEAMDGGISASVGDGMLTITVTLGIDDVNV